MTSSSLNIDRRQSNILQMWGSLPTNTGHKSLSFSRDPNRSPRDSSPYSPSEANRYTFKGEAVSSTTEPESVVKLQSEEIYDVETAASNSTSRPSEILPSIWFNVYSFSFLVILTHSIIIGLGMMLLTFTQMGVISTVMTLIHRHRQSLANIR